MDSLQAGSVCSLSEPKSDLSDFGPLKTRPNSGKPEFGWERVGVRGSGLDVALLNPINSADDL
jgi:hypothetical protein